MKIKNLSNQINFGKKGMTTFKFLGSLTLISAISIFNFQPVVVEASILAGSVNGASDVHCAPDFNKTTQFVQTLNVSMADGRIGPLDSRTYNTTPYNDNAYSNSIYAKDEIKGRVLYSIFSSFQNPYFGKLQVDTGEHATKDSDGTCSWSTYRGLLYANGTTQTVASGSGVKDRIELSGVYDEFSKEYSVKRINTYEVHDAGVDPIKWSGSNSNVAITSNNSGGMSVAQKPLYPISVLSKVVGNTRVKIGTFAVANSCGVKTSYKVQAGDSPVYGGWSDAQGTEIVSKEGEQDSFPPDFNFKNSVFQAGSVELDPFIDTREVRYYSIPDLAVSKSLCSSPRSDGLQLPPGTITVKEYGCDLGLEPIAANIAEYNQVLADHKGEILELTTFDVKEKTPPSFAWPSISINLLDRGALEEKLLLWASQVPATLVEACTISTADPLPSCTLTASPANPTPGQSVVWKATPADPSTATWYGYSWSTTGNAVGNTLTNSYASSGNYSVTATIKDGLNRTGSCTGNVTVGSGTVIPKLPDLAPLGATGTGQDYPNAPVIKSGTKNPNGSYVIGSTISFTVQPKNIGESFVGPDFKVKLQKRLNGEDINAYKDVPSSVATVSGGVASGGVINTTIDYTSLSTDTNATGYDFRYCVDLPRTLTANSSLEGNIVESNEGNNCSGEFGTSGIKFEEPPLPKPVSVTALTPACTLGAGKIDVAWATVSGVEGYRLYRGGDSGFAVGASTLVKQQVATTYADSGLTPYGKYFYKVVAYRGSNVSPASVSSPEAAASELCPDLTVDNVKVVKSIAGETQIYAGDTVSFSADIKNGGGPVRKGFVSEFVLDNNTGDVFPEVPTVPVNNSVSFPVNIKPLLSWTAKLGAHSIKVCADTRKSITESNEGNNCNSTPVTFNVVTRPITVDLKAEPVIVDYNKNANLNWVVSGGPSCVWVTLDSAGLPVPSTSVSAGTIQTGPLVSKGKYTYQLKCTK